MTRTVPPIEDEIGDVLEKAIRCRCCSIADVARTTGICRQRLQDAVDYRSDLSSAEIMRIAAALQLNEVGLCALSSGRYPLPEIPALPFTVHTLSMPHGVGRANAYVISPEAEPSRAVLFDTGANLPDLLSVWPGAVQKVDAVFLTHIEGEHTGGLCDVVDYFGIPTARIPTGSSAPCGTPMREGELFSWQGLNITAFGTPGHAASHNCYLVQHPGAVDMPALLIAGDLIFAGSAGGGFYDAAMQQEHIRRILALCREDTVVAPGHGPLTTVANERRYNPFAA